MLFGTSSEHSGKSYRRTFFDKPVIHFIIIAVIGLTAYSNTFHVPFVFDDQSSITENLVIRSLDNFFFNPTGYDYNPRRVIGYLSIALNYRLGGLDVTGYHAVNLAVHIFNALLVYCLVRLTIRTPFFEVSGFEFKDASSTNQNSNFSLLTPNLSLIPLFAALLFVAHPIQTQAVTYIVQRLTSLETMFCLLALVLYAQMRLASESGAVVKSKITVLYLLMLAAVVLAMKTKEIAFTLPIVVLLYEFSFFFGRPWKRLVMLLPVLATLPIIPLSMLNLDKPWGELLSDVSTTTMVQTDVSRWDYLLTQFSVITTYIRLLFLPMNQNLDYDYPIYESFFAPRVLLTFLFLLALFGLAVYLYYRSTLDVQRSALKIENTKLKTQNLNSSLLTPHFSRLIAFGIFYFFITLSVESSLIPIVDVIFEHRVYLPSVGAFVALATLCMLIFRWLSAGTNRKYGYFFFAVIIMLLTIATFQRNRVWAENVTLWRDVVRKSPEKVRGYNNLGAALSDAARQDEAIVLLRQAINVKPDHPEAYYNLGSVYILYPDKNNDAITMLTKAIELKPDYWDAYVNLAAAYNQTEKFREALTLLGGIKSFLQSRADARFNLGVAYHCLGNADQAARELAVLKFIDPEYADRLELFLSRPYVSALHRRRE